MMFVLLGETNYNGDTLLGVYSNRQAADEACEVYRANNGGFDGYRVVQVVVDAVADDYWL